MDADHDGYLTEADFRALTARWLDLRGTDAGGVARRWGTPDDAAGRGGKVTLDQVLPAAGFSDASDRNTHLCATPFGVPTNGGLRSGEPLPLGREVGAHTLAITA